MSNSRVILTGASRGIGKDICINLLEKGYTVLTFSRHKPNIAHKNLLFAKADLSSLLDTCNKKKIINKFKPCHLISNAGDLGEIGNIEDANIKNWIESFNLNLFSHFILTKLAIPYIKKVNGKLIYLAGGGSASSFPHFSAYSVAKTAIVRFVENLADENKNKIIANVISPGPIYTDLMKKSFQHGHHVDKSRITTSENCIKLINFLLRNKKKFFNGKFIHAKDNYKRFTKKKHSNKFLLRRIEEKI